MLKISVEQSSTEQWWLILDTLDTYQKIGPITGKPDAAKVAYMLAQAAEALAPDTDQEAP